MKLSKHWIDSDAALAAAAAAWSGADTLGVDTEFMREKTFYPLPGLLQISDGEEVWLIDPLAVTDWSPLNAVFADSGVVKLLHSGSEDLELFERMNGELPEPMLDTQTGAALAGLGAALSYQAMVAELVGINLEKSATRSDWRRRPLSDVQLRYAALDVLYLPRIYRMLLERLGERADWWRQEGARDIARVRNPDDLGNYYARVKGAAKLDHRGQFLLQQLCLWREQQARARDLPRGWLVKDSVLLLLARQGDIPGDLRSQLRNPKEMPGARILEELRGVLSQAKQVDATKWPALISAGDQRRDKSELAQLRSGVEQVAKKLGLAPETLASKKDLQAAMAARRAGGTIPLSEWKRGLLRPLLEKSEGAVS